MTAVEQTEDKGPRSFQSFNGTTWHQRRSEARQTVRGEVFSLSHSPGHLVLLTFCLGNTKRDRRPKSILSRLCVQQVGGWSKRSWRTARRMAGSLFLCVRLSVCGLGTTRVLIFVCSSREVIVNSASSCDTSDQKHCQVERQSRPLSLRMTHCRLVFHSCPTDCFFSCTSASIRAVLHCKNAVENKQ